MISYSTEQELNPNATSSIASIELQLQRQFRGMIRDLQVKISDEGIFLHGCASTYYAKQLAQHAVLGKTNLPLLGNEIQVV